MAGRGGKVYEVQGSIERGLAISLAPSLSQMPIEVREARAHSSRSLIDDHQKSINGVNGTWQKEFQGGRRAENNGGCETGSERE